MSDTSKPIPDSYAADFEMYYRTISGDPVATILRFHLLTEFYLEQFIRALLKRGDRIVEPAGFSYAQKLCIVDATDNLADELISALRNLNKLRNKCSHELHHQISVGDLETVGSPLGKTWTEIKKENPVVEGRMHSLFSELSARLVVEIKATDGTLFEG